jgi:hypothetical protein
MGTRRWACFSKVIFLIYICSCLSSNLCFLLSDLLHPYDFSYRIFLAGDFLTRLWIINPLPVIVSALGMIYSLIDNNHPEYKELQRKYRRQLLTHLIASPLIWLLSGMALVAFTGGV